MTGPCQPCGTSGAHWPSHAGAPPSSLLLGEPEDSESSPPVCVAVAVGSESPPPLESSPGSVVPGAVAELDPGSVVDGVDVPSSEPCVSAPPSSDELAPAPVPASTSLPG